MSRFKSAVRSFAFVFPWLFSGRADAQAPFELDYGKAIHLDAEELAEGGIKALYDAMRPALQQYIAEPKDIAEVQAPDTGYYGVIVDGEVFGVFDPAVDDGELKSWTRATYIFFRTVNDQLGRSTHRFYALNGGNDLLGIFLTPQEAELAKASIKRKIDRPYLPTLDEPWGGAEN